MRVDNLTAEIFRNAIEGKSMTKQKKQGRWVASDAEQNGLGHYQSILRMRNNPFISRIIVTHITRDECRRRAAAIRDLANKNNW